MAIKRWNEWEISNFEGIASSSRHPKKNECQECKNFDTRYIDGDLTLRAGFTRQYAAPASADYRGKLSSLTWIAFQNFYIPEGGGKEITVWVGKGTLAGETGVANATPANRNVMVVFSSHQFNGTTWVEKNWDGLTSGKYWLNHIMATSLAVNSTTYVCDLDFNGNTVLTGSIDPTASTSVVGVGTLFTTELSIGDRILVSGEVREVATITDNTHLTVTTAFTDNANDTSPERLLNIDNWTIINITKSPYEVAQVISTTNYSGSYCRVNITNNSHNWDADDQIILMKNYIPYDSLIAMYSCTANDITFHKILNDLRIGFGGQENRIGLSIGYRKKSFLIGDIDFGSFTTDDVESLAEIDNLILDTYIPIANSNNYQLDLAISASSGNEISTGRYFFYMTGLLDDFTEILLTESNISLDTQNLEITPKMKYGSHNKRLSKIRIYCASGGTTGIIPTTPYYLLQEIDISKDNVTYEGGLFQINSTGWLALGSATELHPSGDAAAITTESNSIGTFTGYPVAPTSYAYSGAAPTAPTGGGSYGIKLTNSTGGAGVVYIQFSQTGLFKKNRRYQITFQHICTTANLPLYVSASSGSQALVTSATWKEDTVIFDSAFDNEDVLFAIPSLPNSGYLTIDLLSIQEYSQSYFDNNYIPVTNGEEMVSKIGYFPTLNMVRSWDQAIVTQGRTFFVNPYIDKRYENKIFRSHISGAGAFMYDVASAGEYIDLENFDGNSLVGIEILPNLDFIALKTNGGQRVNPNTGATKEISFGSGCISRRSIVNFGDKIVWCGENDIYMSDGLNVISIADKSIRETYRALTTKSGIVSTRDNKDNAYRFFTGDTSARTEYILTKKGWILRVVGGDIYPIGLATSQNGTVSFMDNEGSIYEDNENASDSFTYTVGGGGITSMGPVWKSVETDFELLGEGLTERDFFYISSMWLAFSNIHPIYDSIHTITMSLILDGATAKTVTFSGGIRGMHKQFVRLPQLQPARRFSIQISIASSTPGVFPLYGKSLSVHSVGVLWRPIKAGYFN